MDCQDKKLLSIKKVQIILYCILIFTNTFFYKKNLWLSNILLELWYLIIYEVFGYWVFHVSFIRKWIILKSWDFFKNGGIKKLMWF